MTPLLDARDVALPGRLEPTSIQIGAGELVALVGPNGGGKTSLLRALADVEGDGGLVAIAGESLADAPPARRSKLLAFLPASREIVWPISARDVIALGAQAIGAARIDSLIALLELEGLADRPISSLSTGERARVLLARALAPEPRLLLLDEPLSNLDPYWALRIVEILRSYVEDDQRSAIVALHDLDQAEAFDRVLLVDKGRILADGPPADIIGGEMLSKTFGVQRHEGRWRIRPSADPRSLR
ncbi:MAG: ABC transporter ATP-binding protein [Sphingomicrobium sp.]